MRPTSSANTLTGPVRVARRAVMKAGAGVAAASFVERGVAFATPQAPLPRRAELFAFPAPDTGAAVFAVVAPRATQDDHAPFGQVVVHAGPMAWTVADRAAPMTLASAEAGALIYAGRLTQGGDAYHLAVVAAPRSALPNGPLPVWAEIRGQNSTRLRVGNPIVAELMDRDPDLARVFHRARPADDRALFAEALVERLALRAPMGSALSARQHAERLSALLLPDVLLFDPAQPVGFTYAAQNGRRPSDRVADIAQGVLDGALTVCASAPAAFRQADAFPYVKAIA